MSDLRAGAIEAMAETMGLYYDRQFVATHLLDALLDYLTEHAEEFMEAGKDITARHHGVVHREALVPNMVAVSSLLAVLREVESE